MSSSVTYAHNQASEAEIADHLLCCEAEFVSLLSNRVEINAYAHKIASRAERFEAWTGGTLAGLVAMYCNDSERRIAFITNVSVLPRCQGGGIAIHLLAQCMVYSKELGFGRIELEVDRQNAGALSLYGKIGFIIDKMDGRTAFMHLDT